MKNVETPPAKEILYTEAEVKHIATRFGRECVINQLHTCNDRIMHFEKWFDPANFVVNQ